MIRIDFIFSYWIFIWYLLYINQLTNINPKFALICGIIHNLIIIRFMIYYKTKHNLVINFIIMCIIIKIIPLYTIQQTTIKKLDIIIMIKLFIYYLLWIILNNKPLNYLVQNTTDLILHSKPTLPAINLLDKFFL